MELSYDWRAFEKIFTRLNGRLEGQRVARAGSNKKGVGRTGRTERDSRVIEDALFIVIDRNRVVHAYSPGVSTPGQLSVVVGKTLEEVAELVKDSDLFWVDIKSLHGHFSSSVQGAHYFEQSQLLSRALVHELRPFGKHRRRSLKDHLEQQGDLHFFLQSALGSWKRFFPQSYGIYLRLETANRPQHLLLQFQNGRLSGFYQPEFQGLPGDRRQPEDLVRYLSEKHGIKIIGFYAPASEWWSWSEAKNPWAALYSAFRSKKLKIVPATLAFKSWLAAQATLGKA